MREYIRRVTADVVDVVDQYNIGLEETQSKDNQITHAIVQHNEDLAPLPAAMVAVSPGTIMFGPESLQEWYDILFGNVIFAEEFEELDIEEDED
jgi:hypothetical protein